MHPGVAVTLRVPVDPPAERITGAVIDLRHEPFDDPSTIIHYEVEFDPKGTAQLTVAPGNYSWLLLQHEDFFLTPVYSANHQRKNWLRIEPGRNQDLHFDVHRKVSVRGRVVDADTGSPLLGMSVHGRPGPRHAAGMGRSAPGPMEFCRMGRYRWAGAIHDRPCRRDRPGLLSGKQFVAEQDYYEVSVAADGSTVIPDIKVRRLQKIVGVVQNPDGTPAARAVVRLRGKYMSGAPTRIDEDRRSIRDPARSGSQLTRKRESAPSSSTWSRSIPYRPLAARAEVRLDQPKEIVLKLEPHEPEWPLSAFQSELADWERGIVARRSSRQGRGHLVAWPGPSRDRQCFMAEHR